MILSAQRVVAPDGRQGINCFRYAQAAGLVATTPDHRFFLGGELAWVERQVESGARVVSYIDIALPEDVTTDEITDAFAELNSLLSAPATYRPRNSRVAFRLSMDAELLPFWQREVLTLIQHLILTHP